MNPGSIVDSRRNCRIARTYRECCHSIQRVGIDLRWDKGEDKVGNSITIIEYKRFSEYQNENPRERYWRTNVERAQDWVIRWVNYENGLADGLLTRVPTRSEGKEEGKHLTHNGWLGILQLSFQSTKLFHRCALCDIRVLGFSSSVTSPTHVRTNQKGQSGGAN